MTASTLKAALPAGYTVRSPEIADAAEVASLVNARSLALTGQEMMSVSDILLYWNEPERDITDEDWLVIAPDGRIAAFLELYEYEPFTVFAFDHHIHPAYDGIGIEPVLFDIIEQRARREQHRAPDGARVVLHTFASSLHHDAHRHLEAHGFTHIRDGLQMLIDLDAPPAATWPDGVAVRTFVRNQDERAVWETAEAAWQDHWGYAPMPFEEFLYFRIESAENFDPGLWHLAMDGEQIAGIALCNPERAGFDNTGWVSVLAVRREYRGRGIGLALLQHAFADFARRGYQHTGLGVDASSLTGADRLYRKAGMREIKREFTFEKVLRTRAET